MILDILISESIPLLNRIMTILKFILSTLIYRWSTFYYGDDKFCKDRRRFYRSSKDGKGKNPSKSARDRIEKEVGEGNDNHKMNRLEFGIRILVIS